MKPAEANWTAVAMTKWAGQGKNVRTLAWNVAMSGTAGSLQGNSVWVDEVLQNTQ